MADISEDFKYQTIIETLTNPNKALALVMKKLDVPIIIYSCWTPSFNDGDPCYPFLEFYTPYSWDEDKGYCYMEDKFTYNYIYSYDDFLAVFERDPSLIPEEDRVDLERLLKQYKENPVYANIIEINKRFESKIPTEVSEIFYKLIELSAENDSRGVLALSTDKSEVYFLNIEEYNPEY